MALHRIAKGGGDSSGGRNGDDGMGYVLGHVEVGAMSTPTSRALECPKKAAKMSLKAGDRVRGMSYLHVLVRMQVVLDRTQREEISEKGIRR